MKQAFHNQDKLEEFRRAINYEVKLYCGVDEAYDSEKAADFIQQLSKSWKMSEDDVISTMVQSVKDTIDKQSRMYVLRFLDMMKIPHSSEKIKERWGELSQAAKDEIVDGTINHLGRQKGQG